MSDREKIKQQQDIVDVNLREFQGNSTKFAAETIRNARLRKDYIELARKAAEEILQEARTATTSAPSRAVQLWEQAAEKASKLRNLHLEQTRKNVSTAASAFSKMLKEEGLTFPKLIQKYTLRAVATTGTESANYAALGVEHQQQIMETIVEASGRTNPKINSLSKWSGRFGVALILVTIGLSIYNICEAANPTLEAVKTAVSLGFGAGGAYAGGELGAAIGACGGPVGVLIGAIVGGIAGGLLASFSGESLVDVLYRAFFPSCAPGVGPPPFDVIPLLYGQPSVGRVLGVGQPMIRGAPKTGPPVLREKVLFGQPKLWRR